jgi:type II secretory pathway pseudopilin PulG
MKRLIAFVVIGILGILLAACGPSKREKDLASQLGQSTQQITAIKSALKTYANLQKPGHTGAEADQMRRDMIDTLQASHVALEDLSIAPQALQNYVQRGREHDAHMALQELLSSRGNGRHAEQLKSVFIEKARLAGMSLPQLGTNEKALDQAVARNYRQQADGISAPPQIRRASLVKTVPAPRRAAAKKQNRRRRASKSTLGTGKLSKVE